MTSHMRLPQATPSCDSYERTDGRTNEESWLRTRDNSPSVTRAHTYGDSPFAEVGPEDLERLRRSIDMTGFCWLWMKDRDYRGGYGRLSLNGKRVRAHRWVYELLVGPIPEGLVLDHLCRVHHCVNPDHLEPVTRAENNARSWWAIKRYCPQGHDQSPNGGHVYVRKSGKRMCRTCANEAFYRWQERKRSA